MGRGYRYGCPKCGYSFMSSEGVGLFFPEVYRETVQEAKKGGLGESIQTFFRKHEDGALNAENVTLCCNKCGKLAISQDLTMYIPKEGLTRKIRKVRWSVAMPFEDVDYVDNSELKEAYEKYSDYEHICEECGGTMHIVHKDEVLLCPHCNIPLENRGVLLWD